MKTNTRSVPLDQVSVDGSGVAAVYVATTHDGFYVRIDGQHHAFFTFSEFHAILQKAVNEKQGKES